MNDNEYVNEFCPNNSGVIRLIGEEPQEGTNDIDNVWLTDPLYDGVMVTPFNITGSFIGNVLSIGQQPPIGFVGVGVGVGVLVLVGVLVGVKVTVLVGVGVLVLVGVWVGLKDSVGVLDGAGGGSVGVTVGVGVLVGVLVGVEVSVTVGVGVAPLV